MLALCMISKFLSLPKASKNMPDEEQDSLNITNQSMSVYIYKVLCPQQEFEVPARFAVHLLLVSFNISNTFEAKI